MDWRQENEGGLGKGRSGGGKGGVGGREEGGEEWVEGRRGRGQREGGMEEGGGMGQDVLGTTYCTIPIRLTSTFTEGQGYNCNWESMLGDGSFMQADKFKISSSTHLRPVKNAMVKFNQKC